MQEDKNDTTGREHKATILLEAPLKVVRKVWTEP
jgi:hypothetical protein